MTGLTRSLLRCQGIWVVTALVLAACGGDGQESKGGSSPFVEDVLLTGVVLENVTACEVDAACYLRIEFSDTTVVALYGTGERPAPPCTMSMEVSEVAFPVEAGEVVEAEISRCGEVGYHLRRLVRGGAQR